MHPISLSNFTDLAELYNSASGPFSYRLALKPPTPSRYTAYPLPNGGWDWIEVPATEWTPALCGYPGPENI